MFILLGPMLAITKCSDSRDRDAGHDREGTGDAGCEFHGGVLTVEVAYFRGVGTEEAHCRNPGPAPLDGAAVWPQKCGSQARNPAEQKKMKW